MTPRDVVAAELDRPAMPQARAMAAAILRRGAGEGGAGGPPRRQAVAAILFYGACLRSGDASGLLDLYVLVDRAGDWHPRSAARAAALRLLPPDVESWTAAQDGRTLRAKVAVMTLRQFRRRMRADCADTTLWARFCQPAALLHARDDAAREAVRDAVAEAVATARHWALRLGPERGPPAEYWRALFRATYGAELRAERGEDRAALVHAADAARFDALLGAAPGGVLRPGLPAGARAAARRGWARRRAWGKALNAARLVKAAFTFAGGLDYLAWKVERHSGVALRPTPWQRRHPVLAAPLLLWRLRRRGAVR